MTYFTYQRRRHWHARLVRTQVFQDATMKAAATNIAVMVGLATVLAVTGAIPLSAQIRRDADARSDNASRYCMSPNVDDAEELRLYCEGWRAVRKGW
jgi:hypothetical protein